MPEPTPPRRPLATFLRPRPEAGEAAAHASDVDDGNAAQRLVEVAPEAADAAELIDEVPAQAAVSEPAAVEVEASRLDDAGSTESNADAAREPAAANQAPGFLRARVANRPTPRWHWAVIVALGLVLLLQIAVADRARLAASASTRPAISQLCGLLGCSLPAWHEPDAFTMTSRDVRPVPGQPGALQVQASIRNDARWTQDWPALRLSLADADGRVIGSAVFTPEQYLPSPADRSNRIEPGQSAQLAFQVREPAASTVAFTFEFL